MGTKKQGPRKKSLAAGRPPTISKPKAISRKATKALINRHHQLQKKKDQAVSSGDHEAVAAANEELDALGGIVRYQEASLQGQRNDRGGDTSRVLMEWLKPVTSALRKHPLRMLEIGALSVDNACSKSGCFDIERIDLNSQGPGIKQQDFMSRPRAKSDEERFDIISLSLVLNYVPHHSNRGLMLLQTLDFLKDPDNSADCYFPSLFLVLPEPCVSNSRYLDEDRLTTIMKSLGYEKTESKITRRLVYYLWKRARPAPEIIPNYTKKEIRPGPTRNNFSIVLQVL